MYSHYIHIIHSNIHSFFSVLEPNGVNINDKEWQDPIYAAHVLKEYLLELPVSVISANKYKDFIIAASK